MDSTCELGRHSARALEPYPDYKDSGVLWLGEVPEHWAVIRTKSVLSRNDSGVWGDDPIDDGVVVLRSTEQAVSGEWNITAPARRKLKPSEYGVYRLKENDLVVTKSSGSALHIGKTSIVTKDVEALDCCFSNFMQRLRVKEGLLARFVWYALNGELGRSQFDYLSNTTTGLANLNGEIIGRVAFPLPPRVEQAAIVRFLDDADQRIRRYIRAQQQLVMLLEEQKQAIIHQAITGQIDVRTGRPFPAYKPSGVPWLGDVPEHWEIAQLGRLIDLLTGFPFKSEGFTQDADDIRLLRGANIAPGKVRWNDIVRWPIRDRPSYLSFELHAGDIVLGMDRPIIQSGVRVATIEESDLPSLLLQRVACIRPEGRLRADFLILLLAGKSFSAYLAPIFTGISVPHLSPEQIRLFRFALPAVMEQEKIVEWTVASTKTVESAVKRTHREIALLGEYRTRLIADVVTGKFDVREAAARLPDEVEELEPLDEADALIDGEEEPTDALATAP